MKERDDMAEGDKTSITIKKGSTERLNSLKRKLSFEKDKDLSIDDTIQFLLDYYEENSKNVEEEGEPDDKPEDEDEEESPFEKFGDEDKEKRKKSK